VGWEIINCLQALNRLKFYIVRRLSVVCAVLSDRDLAPTCHVGKSNRWRQAARRPIFIVGMICICLNAFSGSQANAAWDVNITEEELQEIADGTLTLMAFTVLPDITTSSLSIDSAKADDPGISQITLGGGLTISEKIPLYLEGTLGYSRYDPTFVATEGEEQQLIPLKWNTFSATGGIGWDFPIVPNKELKLRPIFNFTLGYMASDVELGQAYLNYEYDLDMDDFDGGEKYVHGLGGAIMLDYEHYREDYEIDVELRYTYIKLQSFGGTIDSLKGNSETNASSIWARWRAPFGITMLQRPLRYLLESSLTSYFGPQRGALGFNNLASVGVGLELDSSAYNVFIARTRLVARYVFGDNVSGYSLGLAVSF
jgi:hypothetical protein